MSPEGLGDAASGLEISSPADDAVESTPDSGIDTGGGGDEGGEPEGGEPAQPADGQSTALTVTDGPAMIDGRMTPAAKQALAELAKTHPKLATELRRARFEVEGYRQALPQGLKEVNQMREQLEQFGGPDAISKTREELNYFNDLDQQFTNGDPRFIQAMIDTPEGQQGFLKLAPTMLAKFKELSPDAHSRYVATQQWQDLVDHRVDLRLLRLQDLLAEVPADPAALEQWKQKASAEWTGLATYYNKVEADRRKEVKAPEVAPAKSTDPDREQQLTQREQQFVQTQWRTEASNSLQSTVNAEIAKLVTARKLNDVQKAAVLELGMSRLKSALTKVPNFNQTSQRYFANKDKDGFMRHVSGVYRQQVPGVLKAAADAIGVKNGVPRPAVNGSAAVTTPSGAAPPRNGATSTPGFSWVAKMPNKTEIAFGAGRTTPTMILDGQAVLLNGKRVQWRKT